MTALSLLALLLAASPGAQGTPAPQAAPAAAPVAAPVAGGTQASPAPTVARRVEGKVTFATSTAGYLDAGALEGLAAGQVIRLTRGGQPSGHLHGS